VGIDEEAGLLLSGPDIISRGFVYVREAEDMMEEARQIAIETVNSCLMSRKGFDQMQVKTRLKDELTRFFYAQTKRKPMILPVIMEL
jgi:ribonuclease J